MAGSLKSVFLLIFIATLFVMLLQNGVDGQPKENPPTCRCDKISPPDKHQIPEESCQSKNGQLQQRCSGQEVCFIDEEKKDGKASINKQGCGVHTQSGEWGLGCETCTEPGLETSKCYCNTDLCNSPTLK